MAFQGEREPGVLEMDVELVESMVQDEITVQEKPVPEGWERHQCRSSGRFFIITPPLNVVSGSGQGR